MAHDDRALHSPPWLCQYGGGGARSGSASSILTKACFAGALALPLVAGGAWDGAVGVVAPRGRRCEWGRRSPVVVRLRAFGRESGFGQCYGPSSYVARHARAPSYCGGRVRGKSCTHRNPVRHLLVDIRPRALDNHTRGSGLRLGDLFERAEGRPGTRAACRGLPSPWLELGVGRPGVRRGGKLRSPRLRMYATPTEQSNRTHKAERKDGEG